MAAKKSTELTALDAGNQPFDPFYTGKVHVVRDVLPVLAGGDGDVCSLLPVPKGYRFMFGIIFPSAADATVTLAIGVDGTAGKYRAAAVTNSVAPQFFGTNAAAAEAPPSGDGANEMETVIVTAAQSASTTAGYVVMRFYAKP